MSGKFYAVRVGRLPGIYTSWPACSAQVAGFPRAQFKGFATMSAARAFLQNDSAAAGAGEAGAAAAAARPLMFGGGGSGVSVPAPSPPPTRPPASSPLTLYFDGGSRGNPGPSGCAAVLKAGDAVVAHSYRWLGERATNNVAEYEGLILGLMLVKDLGAVGRVAAVRGDSMLVIRQVTGEWAVRDDKMVPLHAEARRLLLEVRVPLRLCEHVYREHNSEADAKANTAIDTRSGESFRCEEFFPGHRSARRLAADAASASAPQQQQQRQEPQAAAPHAGAKRRREHGEL